MELGNITTPLDPDKAYVAVEVIIGLFSALGNMFVLFVFVCHPNIRTVTNYYVISLSLADSLVGLFGVPFSIVNSIGIPANFEACLFMNCLLMVLCTSSIFSLVSLALDRYWAITRPLNYKQHMTSRNSLFVISVSWLLAILIGLIPLLGWNLGRPIVPRCFFLEVMDPSYLLFVYLSTIILPTLFIAGIYIRIYITVRKHVSIDKNRNLLNLKRRWYQIKNIICSASITILS